MMMNSNSLKVVTPVGVLKWVAVSGMGVKNNLKNPAVDEYRANVILPIAEATELTKQIDTLYAHNNAGQLGPKKTMQSLGYKFCDVDGLKTDENGNTLTDSDYLLFAFKTGIKFQDGQMKHIGVYNANGQKTQLGDKKIGNGSKGCISGVAVYYVNGIKDGISLYLNSVQLVVFKEYADDPGFTKIDSIKTSDNEHLFTHISDEEMLAPEPVEEVKDYID